MGMSATQARYLSLIAQQSNLEYQGQQINQERAVLSQQVSDLYNSLLNMQVPTPPSTQDFTKVEYQGTLGATKITIPASNVKPGKDGKYCVTVEEKAYGSTLSLNKGYSVVNNTNQVKGRTISHEEYNSGAYQGQTVYALDPETDTIRPLTDEDFTVDAETNERVLKGSVILFVEDPSGVENAKMYGVENVATVAGGKCYTLADAHSQGVISDELYSGYLNAIKNTFPQEGENKHGPEDFYIFQDSKKNWHFALIDDVNNGDESAITYDYIPNGEYNQTTTYNPCGLTFDPGSGRITAVQIPIYKEGTEEVISYSEIALEAVTVTDELAYDEAVNQYEYAQYEYDRQQQEINARTEIIQQQDRNLELKLQRLDTQRTQITTEIDALEKVLNDNIEKSYKTFSG